MRSPIATSHSTDYHIQLMEASLLTEKDCAVLISHTGQSKETIHIAETVRKKLEQKQLLLLAKLILPLPNLAMSFLFLFLKKQNSDLKH